MIVSTVPGAIATIEGYFDNVAADLTQYDLGVIVGYPIDTAPDNYLMIGSYGADGGDMIQRYAGKWATLPGTSKQRTEDYSINCSLVVWSGTVDPTGRISDAFTIFSAVQEQLVNDIGGSGTLSTSGSWGPLVAQTEKTGPFAAMDGSSVGWGVVIEFAITPINIRLFG